MLAVQKQDTVGVAMGIDESRTKREAGGINDPSGGG
jgi:hypothetical protein